MNGSVPPGRIESRRIRARQLQLLHQLALLNHHLGHQGLTVYQALDLVDSFDTHVRELQAWTAILADYPGHGLDQGGPCLVALVRRAMSRVGRGNARLAGRLEALLQDLPRQAPLLRFSRDGRLL